MKIFDITLRNWLIIFAAIAVFTTILSIVFKSKRKTIKIIFSGIFLCLFLFAGIKLGNFKWILLFVLLPSIIFSLLVYLWTLEPKENSIWDVKFQTKQGNKIIRGIDRGVSIFGAAGSGKTLSVVLNLMLHFKKANFAGIIYDFKDGELTELALPLYKDRLKIIALHKPSISSRVNPIHPNYINGEKDINQIVKVILDNLISTGKNEDDFFKDSASSLLAGVMLKFYFDHKQYCTLPHIISFILAVDFSIQSNSNKLGGEAEDKFAKLKDFLTSNKRVAIQGSTFILGLASEKQTAAVISTLANALRKIAFPEAFWVLSENEFDFNINDEKNNNIVSILNEPKNSDYLSPINATIIHMISKQMMVRNRKPSFVLLDEAPTIKLLNMAQIPATMRSFGVSTIYCAQDITQGFNKYGRDGFKEIISNLSTQFFGKCNDPDTAKFYESFFELIKEKTKSVSKKGGDGNLLNWNDTSTTTGEREIHKYRSYEFTKFKVGQFAFLSDGNSEVINIIPPTAEKITLKETEILTNNRLEANFNKIMEEARSILK